MCGKSQKCQKCIRCAAITLAIFCVVQFILAVVKGMYTTNVITADLTQSILRAMMSEEDIKLVENSASMIAFALSIVTVAGLMCGCIVLCSAKFCGNLCGGFCTKIFTLTSLIVFLAISIVWMLMGSALMAVRSGFNEEFVTKQCVNANNKNYGEMYVDMQITKVDTSGMFKEIVAIDELFATSINSYMCTDFCICPGTPADQWYKDYQKVPDEVYTQYNRAKLGYDGKIDLTRFADPDVKKPLFWTYDPTSGDKSDPALVKLSSKSMFQCLENMEQTKKAYQLEQETSAKQKLIDGGMTEADATAKVAENSKEFSSMGGDVQKNKLEEKHVQLVSFIESEYECSGMCSPSLFYLTQSVELGPPKRGCFAPFLGDLTSLVGNLGDALLASGVFFLLMIFFVIPMCCFKMGDNNSIMAYGKEGGEMELAESKDEQENPEDPLPVVVENSMDNMINKV